MFLRKIRTGLNGPARKLSIGVTELEHRLSAFTHLPMPLNAAFQAGKAFEKYRHGGGKKARPLPDFFIGAHAYVAHLPSLTRDPRRVRSFFPSVRLITP